jgi:hypothetical protein
MGLEKERPAQVLISPGGATLMFKNSRQQSIEQYGTVTDSKKKKNKSRAKSSFMPILRSRKDLLGAPADKNIPPPKID